MKRFKSYGQYLAWEDRLSDPENSEKYHCIIDTGWEVEMSLTTKCKRWQTALKRFGKIYAEVDVIDGWIGQIELSCEQGNFHDWDLRYSDTIGDYGWGVQKIDEDTWYIFLDVSGEYAGKERKL